MFFRVITLAIGLLTRYGGVQDLHFPRFTVCAVCAVRACEKNAARLTTNGIVKKKTHYRTLNHIITM